MCLVMDVVENAPRTSESTHSKIASTSNVSVVKGRLGVFSQSTPLACINLLKRTFEKTDRDILKYLQSPMIQVAQSLVPQLSIILSLHPFRFCAQSNTLLYLLLIEILHSNPYLLYLTCGYVSKECLSF